MNAFRVLSLRLRTHTPSVDDAARVNDALARLDKAMRDAVDALDSVRLARGCEPWQVRYTNACREQVMGYIRGWRRALNDSEEAL